MTLGDRIVVMKDGVVQHCGSPLEVYDTPANRFVAGFVGTPPMNFFHGKLTGDNGTVYFEDGAMRIRLLDAQAEKLASHVDEDVVFGVRPEAMARFNEGRYRGEGNEFDAMVNVIEPLGEKMDIFTSTDTNPHIVARIDADRDLEPGTSVTLYLDLRKVHVFEAGENGRNLTQQVETAAV
jgi:multiple sugar transport system ATP-binding protein